MNSIDILKKVTWISSGTRVPQFDMHRIRYKFIGKNEDAPKALRVKQVHGNKIIDSSLLNENYDPLIEADGLYVNGKKNIPISIVTADCLPILVATKNRSFVMAVHAGWKGLLSGIIQSMVDVLKKEDISFNDILISIGPAISPLNFEVGPELIDNFSDNLISKEALNLCFIKGYKDRWHMDLQSYAALSLVENNIDPINISILRICTFAENSMWHSFRKEGESCGKNWSVIIL